MKRWRWYVVIWITWSKLHKHGSNSYISVVTLLLYWCLMAKSVSRFRPRFFLMVRYLEKWINTKRIIHFESVTPEIIAFIQTNQIFSFIVLFWIDLLLIIRSNKLLEFHFIVTPVQNITVQNKFVLKLTPKLVKTLRHSWRRFRHCMHLERLQGQIAIV